ncbi:MAG: HNH/endonuclease VII fold putative polymorphic toxin [Pseudomonas sp.]
MRNWWDADGIAALLHGAEPHFNVRSWDKTVNGSVDGAHGYYNF